MPDNTILERLQALTPKVDSPERLALFQAFGPEHYADAEYLNLIIEALIAILEEGGESFEQNNKVRRFIFSTSGSTVVNLPYIVNRVNTNATAYPVTETDAVVLFTVSKGVPGGTELYVFLFMPGKGIWGGADNIDGQVNTSMFFALPVVPVTIPAIENAATTQEVNYALAPGQTIRQWLNSRNPAIGIQSQDAGYTLFKNGITTYLWTGNIAGNYGTGQLQSVDTDFQLLDTTAPAPATPPWKDTLAVDPQSTIWPQIVDGAGNILSMGGKTLKVMFTNGKTLSLDLQQVADNITLTVPARLENDTIATEGALRARWISQPGMGQTRTLFGVYGYGDLRSLYVYVDDSGKQHVNNRGSGGTAAFAYTNSVFGVFASYKNEIGVNIIAYGYNAASSSTVANNIVAIGAFAGNRSTESDQIFIGPFAGEFIESGTYNVIVCRGSRNVSDEPKYVNKTTILGARIIYTPDEVANGLNQIVLITDGFGNRVFWADTISKAVKVMGHAPVLNLVMDTADSSTLTGTTTETVLKTYTIAANETGIGVLDLQAYCAATGTAGIKTLKVYRNTTNNFGTATLIATLNIANTIALSPVDRKFMIKSGNILYGLTSGFNAAAPGASGAAALSIGYNPADGQYWFVTGQLANGADSMTLKSFEVNFKRQL